MNREELEGVIGHEVSHIRNYDIRISTIAVALASAITMLSSIGGRMMWWLTFTKVELIDPETKGTHTTYPMFKTYSVGLNVNF